MKNSRNESAPFQTFETMLADESGAGLVEYSLILALVSIVALAALRTLGNKASNSLNNAANQLS
jgi:pilus assembly protein Flp/PilA